LRKNSKLQMKRIRVKSMFLKNSVGYGMIYWLKELNYAALGQRNKKLLTMHLNKSRDKTKRKKMSWGTKMYTQIEKCLIYMN
jgi:hypothetical protein